MLFDHLLLVSIFFTFLFPNVIDTDMKLHCQFVYFGLYLYICLLVCSPLYAFSCVVIDAIIISYACFCY